MIPAHVALKAWRASTRSTRTFLDQTARDEGALEQSAHDAVAGGAAAHLIVRHRARSAPAGLLEVADRARTQTR